ncbi:hypothetical protein ACPXCE_09270 [Streptomyces sp. DT24]|uniref:hypothetical protein n=1 Tax=unclassified Streptomyces TaxID=2593676 RepID=UPI0023B8ABDC|nr:hypothetical protein [Streptomyces sp. AM 4-1-1]WEH33628.1 hypothetical protein PZB75_09725 [Streptomyces sp. AM 4-1-1]
MGSELMLGGGGQQEGRGRGGWLARPSKEQRALQARADRDRTNLLYEAQKQEFTAALRTRLTENAMHDITDVVGLAQQLAAGDPYIGAELHKIVQEYARQTGRDIRSFGNGLGI